MERPPECRKDEQYPLLKVANGLSDSIRQAPPVQTQSWTVSCSPKQSWLHRWSEFISASWMTLILLGMSLLIFYALGMGAYRRQPLLVQYNDAQPASNVFFHHIIHRGCHLPFALYSQYLSSLALTYPNLRFNVIFLIDDAMRNTYYYPRHLRISSGFLGYRSRDTKDEVAKQEMKEFEIRHSNVNITVVALNKYMSMTPLRFKWRTIPVSYLSFYTRVFSVWQNGGIGMDLTTYNNRFCNNFRFDRRVTEILKNHNEGLPITDYNILLQTIDEEEDNCFKGLKQLFNDTLSIFNSVFSFGFPSPLPENVPPMDVRAQRTKRNINSNFYEIETSNDTLSTESDILTETKVNETLDDKIGNLEQNVSNNDLLETVVPVTTLGEFDVTSSPEAILELKQDPEAKLNTTIGQNKTNNDNEGPSAVLLYDFSIMSDNVGRFLLREPLWPPFISPSFGFNSKSEPVKDIDKKKNTNTAAQLALSSDGVFVAATDKLHPFLGMLVTAGFQRMRPEFAIQDTMITQCSGVYKNEAYCNIYGL